MSGGPPRKFAHPFGPDNIGSLTWDSLSEHREPEKHAKEFRDIPHGNRLFLVLCGGECIYRSYIRMIDTPGPDRNSVFFGGLEAVPEIRQAVMYTNFKRKDLHKQIRKGLHTRVVNEQLRLLQSLGHRRAILYIMGGNVLSIKGNTAAGFQMLRTLNDWILCNFVVFQHISEKGRARWRGSPAALAWSAGLMPIRIMHIVYGLGRGGIQTGLENLLGRLDRGKFEHIVCALRPPIDHPMCQGLAHLAQVMCLHATESGSRFQMGAIARGIREVKPDIVHSRNWGCIEAALARRAGRVRAAIVHGEHGFDSDMVNGEPRRRAWFRRAAFEMADRVLSVSYHARDLHSKNTGFKGGRVTVIHNGVNDRIYFPDADARARVRAELGLADNEFLIGSVANLAPVKDHMTTLRALAGLNPTVKNWRCLIIGDGPERSRMEAFLNEHPEWKSRVSLPGITRRVPELLRAMDVMVLSSVTEGICNSLLEVLWPAACWWSPPEPAAIPKSSRTGNLGFLFPVGDA